MKIPEKDWGYSFNHPKLIHRHTNKFKAEPFSGMTEPTGFDDGSWYEELFGTIPSEAMEYEWVVPENVEYIYIFGSGGSGGMSVLDNTFGMFIKPVTPGSTLSIVVGAPTHPDGGPGGSGSGADGGGSTSVNIGGTYIFVAPGSGGSVISPPGGGGGGNRLTSWDYWDSDPSAWIDAALVNPAAAMAGGVESPYSLDVVNLGSAGSGMVGGAGADWIFAGADRDSGGGGGGWGGGPGGSVYKTTDGYGLYWHHGQDGRGGRPYVASPVTYAGEPFDTFVNGSTFYPPYTSLEVDCGFLYIRWFVPT